MPGRPPVLQSCYLFHVGESSRCPRSGAAAGSVWEGEALELSAHVLHQALCFHRMWLTTFICCFLIVEAD